MKKTELRIGNLVEFADSVYRVNHHTFSILDREKNKHKYKPILLTEEWLLDFGFEKTKSQRFDDDVFIIQPKKYGWLLEVKLGNYPDDNPNCGAMSLRHEEEEIGAIPPDLYEKEIWTEEDQKRADNYTEIYESWNQPIAYYINKVHQLQNLYFALTGEELKTITP